MPGGFVLTSRLGPGQASTSPYDAANLATHVGDDPVAVSANRVALGASLPVTAIVWMDQVHGRTVCTVRQADLDAVGGSGELTIPRCDAMVTAERGIALAVLVADCVPVLLADQRAGVAGVAHAGRRGVALRVVDATLDAMVALGARLPDVTVVLGPSIGGCCYAVGPDVHAEVVAVAAEAAARTLTGALSLDLRAGLAAALHRRGVGTVQVSPVCTVECADYFSHRRDGRTGRFAGLAWLAP